MFQFIVTTSEDSTDSIRLGAVKLLEDYLSSAIQKDSEDNCAKLWEQVLTSSLPSRLRDKYHSVRVTTCTCFSYVNNKSFELLLVLILSFELIFNQKRNCFGLILGMINDAIPSVKAAACRTIGVYVLLLPPIIINTGSISLGPNLLADTVDSLVNSMSHSNLTVRIRAAWAIANFCDAVIKAPSILELIPQQIRSKLLASMIKGARDNEKVCIIEITHISKVKSNAARAIGNFGRTAPAAVLQKDSTLYLIVDILVTSLSTGSVKVCGSLLG